MCEIYREQGLAKKDREVSRFRIKGSQLEGWNVFEVLLGQNGL